MPCVIGWWHQYKMPSLFGSIWGTFAEQFYSRAPRRVIQCCCWNWIDAQVFPLSLLISSFPFQRDRSQLHSIISILHANLRLRVCFPQKPTCDWTSAWRQTYGWVAEHQLLANHHTSLHLTELIIIIPILQMKKLSFRLYDLFQTNSVIQLSVIFPLQKRFSSTLFSI